MTEPLSGNRNPPPMVGSELPEADFLAVAALLRERRGFDLLQYKDRCVKRRIAKRMRSLGCHRGQDYLRRLAEETGEIDALLAALTITISRFFRNPSTFRELEERILPGLLERLRREGRRRARFWSVGCAGGEEPYSLALLLERLDTAGVEIEILGSDVNPGMIERAEAGWFPAGRLEEVPPELLERYFRAEGKGYRLLAGIRERVRFRRHDILDPDPYPEAELILCRNVLIYFSREEQQRILRRLAAAIPPGGRLVLGKAEILVGESRESFLPESPTERIYRRENR